MPPSATDPIASGLGADRQRLLTAIADPVRLAILSQLRQPRAVTELCDELAMAQPRISHHLAVLRRSGLVEVEAEGRRRVHRWSRADAATDVGRIQVLLRHWLGPSSPTQAARADSPPAPPDFEDYLL